MESNICGINSFDQVGDQVGVADAIGRAVEPSPPPPLSRLLEVEVVVRNGKKTFKS